jgi:hypothetical protein
MRDYFHGIAIARRPPKYVIGTHVSRVEGRVLHAMRKHLNDPELKMWDDEPAECRRANCLKNNEWVLRIADPP